MMLANWHQITKKHDASGTEQWEDPILRSTDVTPMIFSYLFLFPPEGLHPYSCSFSPLSFHKHTPVPNVHLELQMPLWMSALSFQSSVFLRWGSWNSSWHIQWFALANSKNDISSNKYKLSSCYVPKTGLNIFAWNTSLWCLQQPNEECTILNMRKLSLRKVSGFAQIQEAGK